MLLPWLSFALAASCSAPQAPPATPSASPSPGPAASALTGRVEDDAGRPVSGARIYVRTRLSESRLETTRTNERGVFRFELSGACPCRLQVEAEGWAILTLPRVETGRPVVARLQRGRGIEGVVRDGESSRPIPGARVEAGSWRAVSDPWDPDVGHVHARTDAEGRFRLPGLAAGEYSVVARARGYARGQRVVAAGARADFFLFPGSAVVGHVSDEAGKAIAGAVVSLLPAELSPAASEETTASHEDGSFELLGVGPGSYRLVARRIGKAIALSTELSLGEGSERDVPVTLQEAGDVTGRLVDVDGRPLTGRVEPRELNGEPVPPALSRLFRATAGKDGRFRLGSLPPGEHVVAATARGYQAASVAVEVRDREGDAGDVVLRPGLTIRGVVTDKQQRGIGDAALNVSARGGAWWEGSERSAPDGSFVAAVPEAGDYDLHVSAPGYGGTRVSARAGAEGVSVVLTPAGSITGEVVDTSGRPVEAFQVEAQERRGGYTEPLGFTSVSGSDGRFTLQNVREGSCVLSVVAPDYAPTEVPDVGVRPGRTTDVGKVRLSRGGRIRGWVADATGAPVAGAEVEPDRELRRLLSGRSAVSDTAGAFELNGLPPGLVTLRARHPDYAVGRSPAIEVSASSEPAETRIVLQRGCRVEGRVLDRAGNGLASFPVYIFSSRQLGGGNTQAVSDAAGSFVVEHAPAGPARVTLMGPEGGGFRSLVSREVQLVEGETLRVDLTLREVRVSGRITRAGTPVPGLHLRLERSDFTALAFGQYSAPARAGTQRMQADADADGRYEMLVDEPGRLVLQVQAPSGPWPSREVEIPDVEAYTLDIDLPLVSVTGVVVDESSGEPIAGAHVDARRKSDTGTPSMANVTADAGGRFALELEDGDWSLGAKAPSYVRRSLDLQLSGTPPAELRIALARGVSLKGRVVDVQQRSVTGAHVSALALDSTSGGAAISHLDGFFEVTGLAEQPHSLLAVSDDGQFALATATPGAGDVTLVLRPGARVELSVVGPDGTPAAGATAWVHRVGGAAVSRVGWSRSQPDGRAVLRVPAGELLIHAEKEELSGEVVVRVGEGETTEATLQLAGTPGGR